MIRGTLQFAARICTLLAVALLSVSCTSAAAEAPRPGWDVAANAFPTHLPPGGSGVIVINLENVGAGSSTGPVTVTDTLPEGLTATDAGNGALLKNGTAKIDHNLWTCTVEPHIVSCTNNSENMPSLAGGGGGPGAKGPNFSPRIMISVAVDPGASGVWANNVVAAGGEALGPASTTDSFEISAAPTHFAMAGWHVWFSNADGSPDVQAGSHPYEANFDFQLANVLENVETGYVPVSEPRTIETTLPPGLVGDPNATPRCSREAFISLAGCPDNTQVGLLSGEILGAGITKIKVFNLVAPPGVPAELGFNLEHISAVVDSTVRTGGDYGITSRATNTPQRGLVGAVLTLWGVPSDPSHDRWRTIKEGGCSQEELEINKENCASSGNSAQKPFLTLPTACSGPQTFSIRANTWANSSEWSNQLFASSVNGNGSPEGFSGCERLSFAPAITTTLDTNEADTPAGLTVEVKAPTGGLTDPEGLSTSDLQDANVTLPDGLVVNPGQAAGLAACQPWQDAVGTEGPTSCPPASKVGTDEVETPLLAHPLHGNVYILQSNPPNLQILVEAAGEGVDVKLVGNVHLDESTGRLTSTFSGTPQLPFSVFKLSFKAGPQAALSTPVQCGVYTTSASFTPWSSGFLPDFSSQASFTVQVGPGGGACPSSPPPFGPSLTAGSTSDQAGSFTNFSTVVQSGDGQQRVAKLQFTTPAGLSGMIANVPLCQEPAAAAGTCPASSQIGHAIAASGPGPSPLVVPQPGQPQAPIYLTGPYEGAPFGLSIVVPIVAGPFVLETQRVRAKLDVDPRTAQITVTTDPLPQIVDGVPTDLRTIDAVIDRPRFMFNPTSCNPLSFVGVATSANGATAPLVSRFRVGACSGLRFAPSFKVSTSGRTSKANGASLIAKIAYPSTPPGSQATSQANIQSVKVDLPKQLPSRLTTLQKACPAATFEANPASCPASSVVGHAKVITPVLPVPLTGPAYFVSHGGEAFPNLTIVLRGYGITVDLVGATLIRKGITSNTFKSTPDVPFSTFELVLPQGKYSALAANANLCKSSLAMPTTFTAQNGLVLRQNTKIGVTGCKKARLAGKRKGKHRKTRRKHPRRKH